MLMTLLLIAVVIVAALLIVSSLLWFTRGKKEPTKSKYQEHMESLKLIVDNWRDRDPHWDLTWEFINLVYQLHVLTWRGAAIQRQSMSQRIRKHWYMSAINQRPIYMNKPRTWKKWK